MSSTDSRTLSLDYGERQTFSIEMTADRVLAYKTAPPPLPDLPEALHAALSHPLDFPPFENAVISGDHVVIALDRGTPESAALIAGIWRILSQREVSPEDLVILQPAGIPGTATPDPRALLPEDVRSQVTWKIHDPTIPDECTYLAATTTGERVYLARELIDADLAISVGPICFDSVIGHRGTNSVFFPGLSSADALSRAIGQGHSELGPDDERPLRRLMDEVGWLMGTQFSLQVIPAAAGGVSHVLAGSPDSVFQKGTAVLADNWLMKLDARPEIVVAAVDGDKGEQGWESVCAALSAARRLVANGGKVVLLTELESELRDGMRLMREAENPLEALQPLRQLAPPDLVAATQLAGGVEWADVYLLSKLPSDLVEDLFLIPVHNEKEIGRLLGGDDTCAFLSTAQYVYGQIDDATDEAASDVG